MIYFFVVLILTALTFTGTGCDQAKTEQKSQTNIESVMNQGTLANQESTTDDEPLLLLDETIEVDSNTAPLADNSRCYVCHINYMKEDITLIHAQADIGCADCHGDCDEHIADESWASGGNGTPPDIMYPAPKINPFCMSCHTRDKIDTEQHKPLFAGNNNEQYCTDCHGNHRLAHRRCKWK